MPEKALSAPSVGYMRALSDEGILSLKPGLVLATREAGPDAVLEKVAAVTKLVRTPQALNVDSAAKTIEAVAQALGKPERGAEIVANLRTKCDSAAKIAQGFKSRPRVLYFNSRGDASSLYAHGKETVADFYITGGGGQNVVDFEKIKPLSEEALVSADPAILLLDKDTFDRLGGLEGLASSALFSKLKAVKEKRVVVAPTAHFFGVGPYAGELLLNFQKAFHP
jgi:iron complex transport system substrate-binding protein